MKYYLSVTYKDMKLGIVLKTPSGSEQHKMSSRFKFKCKLWYSNYSLLCSVAKDLTYLQL